MLTNFAKRGRSFSCMLSLQGEDIKARCCDDLEARFSLLWSSENGKLCTDTRRRTRMWSALRSLRLAALGLACVVVGTLGVAVHTANHVRATTAVDFGTFKSEAQQDVGLRFIRNSGVCETTPGVDQLSGYIDFGTNMSMVRLSVPFLPNLFPPSSNVLVVLVF